MVSPPSCAGAQGAASVTMSEYVRSRRLALYMAVVKSESVTSKRAPTGKVADHDTAASGRRRVSRCSSCSAWLPRGQCEVGVVSPWAYSAPPSSTCRRPHSERLPPSPSSPMDRTRLSRTGCAGDTGQSSWPTRTTPPSRTVSDAREISTSPPSNSSPSTTRWREKRSAVSAAATKTAWPAGTTVNPFVSTIDETSPTVPVLGLATGQERTPCASIEHGVVPGVPTHHGTSVSNATRVTIAMHLGRKAHLFSETSG
mmetsp:Transcript_2856/g.9288  ORF Transcript_2856/g.9288 Transcript_2856/m.9288 type:complete len:256 (+) Transcript_2856:625-1392(+)